MGELRGLGGGGRAGWGLQGGVWRLHVWPYCRSGFLKGRSGAIPSTDSPLLAARTALFSHSPAHPSTHAHTHCPTPHPLPPPSSDLNLEFEIPFRELGFHGVPSRSSAFIMPTVNCLVELTEMPFTVLTLSGGWGRGGGGG